MGADDASYGSEQYEEDYEQDSASNTLRLTKGSRKASNSSLLTTAEAETETGADSDSQHGGSRKDPVAAAPASDSQERQPVFAREASDLTDAGSVGVAPGLGPGPGPSAGLLLHRHSDRLLAVIVQDAEAGQGGQGRGQGQVVLAPRNDGLDQVWALTAEGYLESQSSGLVVEVAGRLSHSCSVCMRGRIPRPSRALSSRCGCAGGVMQAGSAVSMGARKNGPAQKWTLTAAGCLQSAADEGRSPLRACD